MRKTVIIVALLLASALALGAGQTNEKVVPQPPVTVTCTDAGTVAYSPGPNVIRYDIFNTSALGVCFAFCDDDCTDQAPDRTAIASCNFVLGAYAGNLTTPDIWTVGATLDADVRKGIAAFECDSNGNAALSITEYHRIR